MAHRFNSLCLRAITLLGFFLSGCSDWSRPTQPGTSVVVLVDFSRSFTPLGGADERALNAVTAALAEFTSRSSPPVTFYWSRIETHSVLSERLCKPTRVDPKLIRSEGELDKTGLRTALAACAESIVKASAEATQRSQYTDIRGALALANEDTNGRASERVFVVFSDFLEDLPPGDKRAEYSLNGSRVLLLHRSGSDSRETTAEGHLALMAKWVAEVREKGATEVITMPVFGATEHRVGQSLTPRAKPAGTAVSVIVDTLYSSAESLRTIANALSRIAQNWIPPVTVTWFAVEDSARLARPMPPVEYAEQLVKKPGVLSTRAEFAAKLEECALGTARWRRSQGTADISGAINLQQEAGQFEAQGILVVVSDLQRPGVLSVKLAGSKVVMISAPNATDGGDEQQYFRRLHRWEQMFRDAGAGSVCRVQLRNLTPGSLTDCLPEP